MADLQFVPLLYENLPGAPSAKELLADSGYDGDRFPTGPLERAIVPCVPSTRSRKVALPLGKTLHRQLHRMTLT